MVLNSAVTSGLPPRAPGGALALMARSRITLGRDFGGAGALSVAAGAVDLRRVDFKEKGVSELSLVIGRHHSSHHVKFGSLRQNVLREGAQIGAGEKGLAAAAQPRQQVLAPGVI